MTDLEALLKRPLFADVHELDLRRGSLSRVWLQDGQLLFDQADETRDVYFPLSGQVMAVFWAPDGKELIFNRMGQVDYFGEIAALDGGERSLSAYASGPTEVLILKREAFLHLIETVPIVRERVMQGLVARIRDLTDRAARLSTQSVDERVKAYLARIAMEAGQFRVGGELRGLPTQAEIAGLIGANREAVSRAISDLKKTGIIQAGRQRITLIKPEGLMGDEGE